MQLREYQTRSIAALRAAYGSGKRAPCLVLPTGAGKTVIAAEVIRSAVAKGRRVLFLAHRAELLAQTVRKLELAGVTNVRIVQAAHDSGDPRAPVVVASIQTVVGRTSIPADLVVIDECHHCPAETWARLVASYGTAHLLGMTATPQRGDGQPLGDIFDAIVVGATVAELTALGHLVPCRVLAPPGVLDTAQTAMTAAEAYARHADGKRAVIFCQTVEHAESVARDMGDSCAVVHGGMRADLRADALARFRAGELRAIANVFVLSEGWDDPAVEVCILARKPQHAGTFLQMVGRVLRPAPGKAGATLVDLCGSVFEHGTPDCEREYALDGKAIKAVARDAIRQCPACGGVFLACAVCPQCGFTLPVRAVAPPRSVGVGVAEVGEVRPRRRWVTVIAAKYAARCARCDGGISVGESIEWVRGERVRHERCGPTTETMEWIKEMAR